MWPRTNCLRIRDALLGSLAALAAAPLQAGDWPQYRGANHDGISTETIRTNWSVEAPRQIWKVPLDPALSSFSVSQGKAFTLVRRPVSGQDQEFCIALDADTGQELWSSVPLGIADYPNVGVGPDDGPRSTPSVDGDRVYVLTSYLRLYCLSTTNGAVVWSKDLVTEYGSTVIAWQSAASPLIEGDLIFVHGNAPDQCLLAFHKSDGSEAWKGQNDVMTQASPIAATIASVRQIIFFAKSGLVSVVPDTGSVLWRYPFPFSTSTAASPVVGGDDMVYCSAAYGIGAGAVRISNSGTQLSTSEVWRTPFTSMNHWATPVFTNGHLYGIYGHAGTAASLRCLELATGIEKWRQSVVGMGGVLFVSGHVLVLNEDGYLALVKPDPTAYVEVARFRALDGSLSSIAGQAVKCWNVPAISNGRIYARSTTEAVCLDVAAAALPTNSPPNAPINQSPFDGATNQPLTLTLQASAFSDPDGDSHASSGWVIKRGSDNTIAFDSGDDSVNKTSITVPAGILSYSNTYSWYVYYTDSNGAQGPASTPTSFTTQPPPPPTNSPPNAPINQSPVDGATNQPLALTLQASAFIDPDGDSHASSAWVIKRGSDNTIAFDSGDDSVNKTSITVPAGILSYSATYSWSVHYTDANGAQGPVSTPTSFTTQPPPPLKLLSTMAGGTGLFQLFIDNADGLPLDTNRAANIDIFGTTNLVIGSSGWIKLTNPAILTNGRLLLEDPDSAGTPQHFFRVEERP